MSRPSSSFSLVARLLHWVMALAILAMLFIGTAMVANIPCYPALLAVHRPLGITILVLALIRLAVRLSKRPPALPADLPAVQALAAHASHWVLYALMLALPLVGWAMQSAGGYPITLTASLHLPPLLDHDLAVYAKLRTVHACLAYSFFAVILVHLAAALYHGLVRRDGVLSAMTTGND